MKKKFLKATMAIMIASVTVLTPIAANAAWKQNSTGWWYTQGNSYARGWCQIDNQWYYFDGNGYMKTGWLSDNGKWYYLNSSGAMVSNTTIDGYYLGYDGVMYSSNAISSVNETINTQQHNVDEQFVYKVSNGKVYHSSSECSNMKSPIKISIDDALNQKLKPCPKCH
ncbi:cell wall-binding protein [Clostridium botulinum]|uniref:cell wall-binding protein n=1 Tax=Clostridium botulinum TaxID=1491 RepID=UPI0028BE1ED4|nr:cell wall-binding protein [Clostridium botulinum]